MNKKILITDGVHPILLKGVEELGFELTYLPKTHLEKVKKIIHLYNGIIINSKIKVDKVFLDLAQKLEFIGRLGSGMEIIDIPLAESRGISVFSSPAGNCNAVGEHALGLLLSLANNLNSGNEEVKSFKWFREKNRGWELHGKKIGLIGFGHTGPSFAEKLKGFDMDIMVYDKYRSDFQKDYPWVREVDLEEIFNTAEIISLHLPLTPETNNYLSKEIIESIRNNFVLINTSRGNMIKTKNLIHFLNSGKIKGACLDVFEKEQMQLFSAEDKSLFSKLFMFKNVIVSPHVAGWTKRSKKMHAEIILRQVADKYRQTM